MDNLDDVEELISLWNFDETIEDVKAQLRSVANKVAEARREAIEQGKTHKENVKRLIHILSIAYKERDEARFQLHKLTTLSPQTTLMMPNSNTYDRGSSIIDNLAKERPRPKKGKLLESVIEAGPLLSTLLVSGSLPKWQDPPPATRAVQVPPVPINEYNLKARARAQVQVQTRATKMGFGSTHNMLSLGGDSFGSYLNPCVSVFFNPSIRNGQETTNSLKLRTNSSRAE